MIEEYEMDQYVAWWLKRENVLTNSQPTRIGVLFDDFCHWLKNEKGIYDQPRRLRFGDSLAVKGFKRISKYRNGADLRAISLKA